MPEMDGYDTASSGRETVSMCLRACCASGRATHVYFLSLVAAHYRPAEMNPAVAKARQKPLHVFPVGDDAWLWNRILAIFIR